MKRVLIASLIAFALLFAVSGIVGNGMVQTPRVMAQDATVVPTTGTTVQSAQPAQADDDAFPWGLLGLLGLAGLGGLRRREEPVRHERVDVPNAAPRR